MTQTKKKSSTTSPRSRTRASGIALKGTVRKGKPPKSEMRHVSWSAVEVEQVNPLLARQLVVGQNIMVTRIHLKKGCIVPKHSHPNEQISYITEGALKFWVGGREIVVSAGEVLTIPPNLPHKAEALADTVSVDIFDPPRADWIEKTDGYLR